MSNEEIAEKLEIIETQLNYLTFLLPKDQQQDLKDDLREIRERYYERRMGEDL